MTLPWTYNFDEASYLRDHPNTPAAYEACIATCDDEAVDRYTLVDPEPTVSIVVPCYQVEDFLEYTFDSIRSQTFQAWECIAVDDGSTDQTPAIIRDYEGMDDRFKSIFHRAQGGPSAARNTGIRAARGRFTCFLDADDLMMRSSLANRVRAILLADNDRVGGSYSGILDIEETCERPPKERRAPHMGPVDFITAAGLCPFNPNPPMFKTSVLRSFGGFDERISLAEDWDAWMRILRHGYYLVPTGMIDVTYRTRSGSNVRSKPLRHLEASQAIYEASHSALPSERVYDDAPFVYAKPWIAYKRQLDLASRVIEYAGMAMSAGESCERLAEVSARTLPDFSQAIARHCDLAKTFSWGVARQLTGAPGGVEPSVVQAMMGQYLEAWAAMPSDEPDLPPGDYPDHVGRNAEQQRATEIVFLPISGDDVQRASRVLDGLRDAGISYDFIDLTVVCGENGVRAKLEELGLVATPYGEFVLGNFAPELVVHMRDSEPVVSRVASSCARVGIPSICLRADDGASVLIERLRASRVADRAARARFRRILMGREEALLGSETLRRPVGSSRASNAMWALRLQFEPAVQQRLDQLQRKYRKLRRNPRGFLADSRIGPLNAIGRLIDPASR